jgi:exosortase H (IPTLxxWG-CTERM-specific)
VNEAIRGAEPGEAIVRGRDPWRRFALVFAALAVTSELIYYGVALESDLFATYLALLARISGFLLGFVADEVAVRGTLIKSSLFSVEIARGCDAYRICTLLSAAIIAFPASLRVKLWGLMLGLLWLNFLNFVRILGLFFIGGWFPEHFRPSHEIYFPIFLICMTMAAWILWLRRATREAIRPQASPA